MKIYPMYHDVLYQSAAPVLPGDESELLASNLTYVVNLAGNTYNLSKFPDHRSFTYLSFPFDDTEHLPDLGQLWHVAHRVLYAIANNEKILVHSAAGLNRASLLTGIVLHLSNVPNIVQHIRVRREHPNALCNRTFTRYLDDLPGSFSVPGVS